MGSFLCKDCGRENWNCKCRAIERAAAEEPGADSDDAADNLAKLVDLVGDMRNKQTEYFRTRNGSALQASKRAEKAVDAFLMELTRGDNQARLF